MRSFYLAIVAGLLLATAAHAAPQCSAQRVEGNDNIIRFPCPEPKYTEYQAQNPDKALECRPSGYSGANNPTGFVCEVHKKRLATP